MKKLILTFILLLTVSFAFANTNTIIKTPKNNSHLPYYFGLNMEISLNNYYNIKMFESELKTIEEIINVDCGSFANGAAIYGYLNGENYWGAWFYAFGYCVKNMQ